MYGSESTTDYTITGGNNVSESKKILALYDCRSKQEYIYRTNKVKEIIGASMLLSDLFKDFFVNNNTEFKFGTD